MSPPPPLSRRGWATVPPLPLSTPTQAKGVLGDLAQAERAYMEAELEMRQHKVCGSKGFWASRSGSAPPAFAL